MSGFDNTFRSQALVTQAQQNYNQQGQQAVEWGINTLQQGGRDLTHAMEFQAQEARLRAETNMRLQLMEQEKQENAYKLQAMAAIDQVKQSRLQSELLQTNVEGAKLQLEQQKKQAQFNDDYGASAAAAKSIEALGGVDVANSYDYAWDYDEKARIKNFRYDPEAAKAMRDKRHKFSSEGRLQAAADRVALNNEFDHIKALKAQPTLWYGLSEADRARLDKRMIQIASQGISGSGTDTNENDAPNYDPTTTPSSQNGTATPTRTPTSYKPTPRPELPDTPDWPSQLDPTSQTLYRRMRENMIGFSSLSTKRQQGVVVVGGQIGNQFIADGQTMGKSYSPTQAALHVDKLYRENPVAAGFILRAGGFTEEEVDKLLTARGLSVDQKNLAKQQIANEIERYLGR